MHLFIWICRAFILQQLVKIQRVEYVLYTDRRDQIIQPVILMYHDCQQHSMYNILDHIGDDAWILWDILSCQTRCLENNIEGEFQTDTARINSCMCMHGSVLQRYKVLFLQSFDFRIYVAEYTVISRKYSYILVRANTM